MGERLTDADLDRLLKLRNAAVGGRWYTEEGSHIVGGIRFPNVMLNAQEGDEPCWIADFGAAPGQPEAAEFSAAAANAVPALVAEVRELRRVISRLRHRLHRAGCLWPVSVYGPVEGEVADGE